MFNTIGFQPLFNTLVSPCFFGWEKEEGVVKRMALVTKDGSTGALNLQVEESWLATMAMDG